MNARAKAWEIRRAKYGTRGHSGSYARPATDFLGRRALALVMQLHDEMVLSEGQCCKALDLDRIDFRILRDAHAVARERSEHLSPRQVVQPIREAIP